MQLNRRAQPRRKTRALPNEGRRLGEHQGGHEERACLAVDQLRAGGVLRIVAPGAPRPQGPRSHAPRRRAPRSSGDEGEAARQAHEQPLICRRSRRATHSESVRLEQTIVRLRRLRADVHPDLRLPLRHCEVHVGVRIAPVPSFEGCPGRSRASIALLTAPWPRTLRRRYKGEENPCRALSPSPPSPR